MSQASLIVASRRLFLRDGAAALSSAAVPLLAGREALAQLLHPNGNRPPTLETIAMRTLKQAGVLALTLVAALMSSAAWADHASPVGLWENIDDVSGKPRALIRITESNGTLQGKIVKVFRAPNEDQNPKCEKCEGALKNAPVIGLVIITGLKKDGDEYVDGQILDPDNGKVYRCKVHLTDGGKKLSVRGYIGVPMLGRSQTWVRQE